MLTQRSSKHPNALKPHGAIACPHCGYFTTGVLEPYCEECDRLWWPAEYLDKVIKRKAMKGKEGNG